MSGLTTGGCSRASDDQVTIYAAASTIDALNEVLESFDAGDTRLRVNYAASSALARLMLQGVQADLFLSAHAEWAEKVQAVDESIERMDLLTNRLVLITPADSDLPIESLQDLANDSVRRIALADPQSVPAGKYAKQLLEEAGAWKRVQSRVAAAADVRQALALVQQGAADAGIVYASDVVNRRGVRIVRQLDDTNLSIVYPLVRTRYASQNPVVDQLVDFIRSEKAAGIFARHGFHMIGTNPE